MAHIEAQELGIEFPLYHLGARSLKKRLLAKAPLRLTTDNANRIVVSALRDLTFTIRRGERVALIGHNGAGKTTLLRTMAGIYEPIAGRLSVEGTIGSLIDPSAGMLPESTGRENIALNALYRGLSKHEAEELAEEVADFSGLAEFLDVPIRTYSSGMAVRLSFAMATAMAPQVLLMDEWISAGDAEFITRAEKRLSRLVTGADIMVIATHDFATARRWCTRAIRLETGRIVADGPVEEVLEEVTPKPAATLVAGAALEGKGDEVEVEAAPARPEQNPALATLLDPSLEPMFSRPERMGVISAWWGHVPFAQWLVRAARPRLIVELGTHQGVSYSAFCRTVEQEKLPTRCYAVDTWLGDEQAGHYDESVHEELRRFHDPRFGGFSSLLRMRFDEALEQFNAGSIDLLHIDGFHSYEAVRHDFDSWLPKMSPRGVVLLHDTQERRADFGVWRLWEELAERYPSFEFHHSHGLGLVLTGSNPPPALAALCEARAEAQETIRRRFALIGEHWALEAERAREEVAPAAAAAEAV
jgi:lipopolysaccharide transport system ATP-binding protein